MIRRWVFAALAAGAILVPFSAQAGVSVRFVAPDRYSDAGVFDAQSRDVTLAEIRRLFQQLGARYLAPGRQVRIDVLDIDLAGQYEPWRRNLSNVRIIRDVTPPRFRLHYVLSERGRRLRSGEATVTNIDFQSDAFAQHSSDRLRYEKAMLTDWFRTQFAGG